MFLVWSKRKNRRVGLCLAVTGRNTCRHRAPELGGTDRLPLFIQKDAYDLKQAPIPELAVQGGRTRADTAEQVLTREAGANLQREV
jgi:hypothetical protein